MAYRGQEYKAAVGDYTASDVIIDRIAVRKGYTTNKLAVFLKTTSTAFRVEESIDGDEWITLVDPGVVYSPSWKVIDLSGANYPTGTLLRVVATGAMTVDQALVTQDW
jgi:hypothetical protein